MNRKKIIENIKGVTKVIPQNEWDYSVNIRKIKPDFMVHGDDWLLARENLRELALQALSEYGGKLIEIPYTKGSHQRHIKNQLEIELHQMYEERR